MQNCSEEDVISYIKNNNFNFFSKNITVQLINETDIFTSAVEEGKLEYVHFMINKVKNIELIEKLSKSPRFYAFKEIKELMKSRISIVKEKLKVGYTRLHIAVMDNETDLVDYLLSNQVIEMIPKRIPHNTIESPLHLAIRLCHFQCVKKFIEHKVDVDTVNQYNETPLHLALLHNLPNDCCDLFCGSKRIDDIKYNGFTILQMAVILNRQDILASILKTNANISLFVQSDTATSLKEKVARLSSPILRLPLTAKENSLTLSIKLYGDIPGCLQLKLDATSIGTADGDGNTLLHLAAIIQDISLCRLLLSKKAPVNAVNKCGNNAIQEMLSMFHKMPHSFRKPADVGILLIDYGIDVDRNGSNGRTILYKSSMVNCIRFFEKVAQTTKSIDLTVVEFEAIVKRRWFRAVNNILSSLSDSDRQIFLTPYVLETYRKFASDQEVTALLNDAPSTIRDEMISKILNDAAVKDKYDSFEMYLKIEVQGVSLLENGETILTNLLIKNKVKFVALLLCSQLVGHCINMKNRNGNTPLHIAAKMENMSICNMLIVAGSNVNAMNNNGDNALQDVLMEWKFIGQSIANIVEIGILLIDAGIDTKKKGSNGRTILSKCSKVNSERLFLKVLHSCVVVDLTVAEVESICRMRWFTSIIDICTMVVSDDRRKEYLTETVVNLFCDYSSDLELVGILKQCNVDMRRAMIDKCLNRTAVQGATNRFRNILALAVPEPDLLENGETILTHLILIGKWAYAMLLLESTAADIYVNLDNESGEVPLHLASRKRHKNLCSLLLAKQADVNELNGDGDNALHELLFQSTDVTIQSSVLVDIGTLLIDNGIDTDLIGSDGRTILHKLIHVNNERFFIKVLETMSSIDISVQEFEKIVDKMWFTAASDVLLAMEDSARHSYVTEIVIDSYYENTDNAELLRILTQEPNEIKDELLHRIQYKAAMKDDKELFIELLKIDIHDPRLLEDGQTLLTSLMLNGKNAFIAQLLETRAGDIYINTRNKSSEFPLHVAIRMKDVSLIDHFLVETIDICSENDTGDTFLGLLFHHFNIETEVTFVKRIAKIIIGRGGNVYHKNKDNVEDIEHCCQKALKENLLEFAKKQLGSISFNKECSICLCNPIDCSLNCGHVFCAMCATKVDICPVCRKPFDSIRKLYL